MSLKKALRKQKAAKAAKATKSDKAKPANPVKARRAASGASASGASTAGVIDISTPELFCSAWTEAKTLPELVEKTGRAARTLTSRAAAYRNKRNIPLKFFRAGASRDTDWEAIRAKVAGTADSKRPQKRKPA